MSGKVLALLCVVATVAMAAAPRGNYCGSYDDIANGKFTARLPPFVLLIVLAVVVG